MAAYATGQDLVVRYDVLLIGDLCQDSREPLNDHNVTEHPNVLSALLDASGEVDSALLSGGRYRVDQLESIANPANTGNNRFKLVRIVCDIAMSILLTRRADPRHIDQAESLAKTSRAHLNSLARGENVLGLPELVSGQSATVELATLSSVELDNLNSLPSRMTGYFPPNHQRVQRGY